jgi:hypothetical protein
MGALYMMLLDVAAWSWCGKLAYKPLTLVLLLGIFRRVLHPSKIIGNL